MTATLALDGTCTTLKSLMCDLQVSLADNHNPESVTAIERSIVLVRDFRKIRKCLKVAMPQQELLPQFVAVVMQQLDRLCCAGQISEVTLVHASAFIKSWSEQFQPVLVTV